MLTNKVKAMIKKEYIAPAIELFEIESEGSILQASSIGVGVATIKNDDGTTSVVEADAADALSNKRQPWGSSPWE